MRKIERIISTLHLESPIAASPKFIRDRIARKRYGLQIVQMARMRTEVTPDNYTLRGFDEQNCIFIHVPKCAGVSVTNALFGNYAGGHLPLYLYLALYGSRKFDKMFKFTFVRNPWDRIASAYFFLKNGGMTETDAQWAEEWLGQCNSLDDFVQNVLPEPRVREMIHFQTQTSFLTDPRTGKIGCDFVGRYESLAADFDHVAAELGGHATLPKLNTTKDKRLWREEMSQASIEIIGELYERDVRELDYGDTIS